MESEVYRISDICKKLNMNRGTLMKVISKSQVWFKIGRQYRLNKTDYEKWIDELKINKSETKN